MNAPPMIVSVHPERMLAVTLGYPGPQPELLNVISCRYVPLMMPGPPPHRVIAVEIIHDPNNPTPLQPYQCYANQLAFLVLPANALLHVQPYVVFNVPPPPYAPPPPY